MNAQELVRSATRLATVPLVPEVKLHLLMPDHPLWHATPEEAAREGLVMPYWAVAWPGGQLLARWILDHPHFVRGKRVLDVGCGGAIEGLAAALAGAAQVACLDLDPLAIAAVTLNAEANGVSLEARVGDVLEALVADVDVVLVGDLSFEVDFTRRLEAWIARSTAEVLLGDAGRVPLTLAVECLAEGQAPFDGDPRGSVPWTVRVVRWPAQPERTRQTQPRSR